MCGHLSRELEYRVQDMDIIRLEETQKIKKEKDMLTLLTCHPYRGNGKFRYLVYSVRKRRKEGDRSMTECRKIQKTQDVRVEHIFPENLRNNSAYIIADRNMGNVCKGCQTQLVKENRYEQSHCDLSVEK